MKVRYYKDQYLGVVGVTPRHQSGKYTFLLARVLEYTWVQIKDLHETRKKAEKAPVARFELAE